MTNLFIFITKAHPNKVRSNKTKDRGDYPDLHYVATTPIELGRALCQANNTNRITDLTTVVMPNLSEHTFRTEEFQARISKNLPKATRAGVTMEDWIETFTEPTPTPQKEEQ